MKNAFEYEAEIAALREELAELSDLKAYATIPLRERCAARKDLEQRNAELVELLRMVYLDENVTDAKCDRVEDLISKPTESELSL